MRYRDDLHITQRAEPVCWIWNDGEYDTRGELNHLAPGWGGSSNTGLGDGWIDFNTDLVFNALHGKYGEDGFVQSILEFLKIPYTHSGVVSSSLAMDKMLSRVIFKKNKLKVPKYFLIEKNYKGNVEKKIKSKKIKFPIVIKPNNEGSSLGVYICKNKKNFKKNYNKIKNKYNRILFFN